MCLYEYTITYTISGNEIIEKGIISTPSRYCSAYVLDVTNSVNSKNRISIVAVAEIYKKFYGTIIETSQNITVRHFDYVLIRKYKVSSLDDHELGKK